MIKILISGPQGSGKSRLADAILTMANIIGILPIRIWTTNEDVKIPRSANEEL